MPEEATLDAFAGDATESDDATGDEQGDGENTTADEPSDGGGVALAAVTSSWTTDGGACASCGESAGRLWEDGGERVCTACKPWTRTGEAPCDQ